MTLTPNTALPDCFTFRCLRPAEMRQAQQVKPNVVKAVGTTALCAHPELLYPAAFLRDIPAKVTATGVKKGIKAQEAAQDTAPPPAEKTLRRPFFDRAIRGLTPSEIGTAHHMFMQFADFEACQLPGGVYNECKRLAEKHILSFEQAEAIEIDRIEAFFCSALYQEQMKPHKMRREFKFSVLAPAQAFYEQASETPAEQVLLQGVIDCLIETQTGYHIIDFKTDRVYAGNVRERAEGYRPQLDAYAYAVEQIFERPVIQQSVYFFATKQCFHLR